MNTQFAHSGLAVGFLILSSILLWFFIATRGRLLVKALLVTGTVWYASATFYSTQNLMGWPAPQPVPQNSRILAVRIEEPTPKGGAGGIFLWVSAGQDRNVRETKASAFLDPRTFFQYGDKDDPRAYKLPYSREMHRALVEAQERMKGTPGAQLKTKDRKGKKGKGQPGGGQQDDSPMEFEIINPVEIFPK